MRSEEEMYELILNTAKQDARIRAVYMNGSRANPNIRRDIFQDYDIVYVVTETGAFLADEKWIQIFGELIIMQEPDKLDKMQGREVDFNRSYTYLMQFKDGNRIDLHIQTKEELMKEYGRDKLTVPLLDKDGCLPVIPAPSDEDYWTRKPTQGEYFSKCNDFWWVAPYCAKGLWRKEILYTIEILNKYVRNTLLLMLTWYAGYRFDYKISFGKASKYLKEYIEPKLWNRLMQTYNTCDYDSAWRAVILTCELFDEVAPAVAELLGFEYNKAEAARSYAFIKHIKELPEDASQIY